jgi:hypothetical protein
MDNLLGTEKDFKNTVVIKNKTVIAYLPKDLTLVIFSIYLPMIGLHPVDFLSASCQRGSGALPKPQCEMLEHVRIGNSGVWELRVCHFVWDRLYEIRTRQFPGNSWA